MKKFTKKGIGAFLAVVLVLSVCCAVSKKTGINFAARGAGEVIATAQKGAAYALREGKTFFKNIKNSEKNAAENASLKKEIAALRDEIRMAEGYKTENERLHTLLNFADSRKDLQTEAANIIGRRSDGLHETLTVDKGTKDGVRRGSAALLPEGLVGVVVQAEKSYAVIRTVFDGESAVSAICPRSGDMGIVSGSGSAEDGRAVMNYVDKDARIVVGDVLETSGTGGVFPRGIAIGKVTDIKTDDRGLTLTVGIQTDIKTDRTDTVLIEIKE